MKKIAVVGSLNVDYVVNVKRFPESGETVLARNFSIVPGGKGANQAFALGRMGAPVAMFGAVGNDANADIELDNLRSADVDVSEVLRADAPTGLAMIAVDADGANSIIVAQGANKMVSKEYIETRLSVLNKYDIIIFQLEIPLGTVVYAARKLKAMGKTIILDPAPAPDSLPVELLRDVDYIKPNETELAKLTRRKDVRMDISSACDELLAQGVGCVLASVGGDGVVLKRPGELARLYPVEQVKVVDTTAAGDAFMAAVVYALANERTIDEAVQFANKISTIVVQRKGAQSSIPTREEIDKLWADEVKAIVS